MKKFLAMALALVMMMSVMVVPAFADTTLTGQMGWECVITEEGHECTFDATTGAMTCEGAIETGLTHSVIDSSSTLQLDTDYTIDVVGKLDADNDGIPDDEEEDPNPIPETPTIAVDLYWTDMVFCYSQSWDDTNLTYIWTWTNGEDYIRVDNRSSVGIDASVTFTGDTANGFEDDAVEFVFDDENAVAATWEDNTLTLGYGNQATEEQLAADSTTVVTPSGTLNVEVDDATTMATDGSVTEVVLGQITVNVAIHTEPVVLTTVIDFSQMEHSETDDYTLVTNAEFTISRAQMGNVSVSNYLGGDAYFYSDATFAYATKLAESYMSGDGAMSWPWQLDYTSYDCLYVKFHHYFESAGIGIINDKGYCYAKINLVD